MRLRRVLRTRARRAAALVAVLLVIAGITIAVLPGSSSAPIIGADEKIPVPGGPGVGGSIELDAGLYLPARTPAPAVILAHGFGGSRMSVDDGAQRLARAGFVVLTYSARGFGASGGRIGLDSLDYEVPDARALVDWLATRPEVESDGPGDPRVGVTGGSYGGALALMLAGTDPRIDAVVATATWNDLQQALFPEDGAPPDTPDSRPPDTPAAIPPGPDGVFKQQWAATLLTSVMAQGASHESSPGCGKLMADLCAAYIQVSATGRITPAMSRLLANSSPARVVGNITAPTLLVQGQQDTLFGLDQADANARAIAANGTPVAVSWFPGGHSGGAMDPRTTDRITDWLEYYLADPDARPASPPSRSFWYFTHGTVTSRGEPRFRGLELPQYPGLGATGRSGDESSALRNVALGGPPQVVMNPPGGRPAAITSMPGLGAIGSSGGSALSGALSSALGGAAALPGQTALFRSAPLSATTVITGSPTVTVQVSRLPLGRADAPGADRSGAGADAAAPTAVLYFSLVSASSTDDRSTTTPTAGGADSAGSTDTEPGTEDDDGTDAGSGDSTDVGSLMTPAGRWSGAPIAGAVAPVRLSDLPADGSPVTVTVHLPAVAYQVDAGDSLGVRVSTTDQSFAGPTAPAAYRISLAPGAAAAGGAQAVLTVPVAAGTPIAGGHGPTGWAIGLLALVVAAALGLLLVGRTRARRDAAPVVAQHDRSASDPLPMVAGGDPAAADPVPMVVTDLSKEYPGGVKAVESVSFTVRRGQVLGLLGPNGAGKTTTLRMALGLISPTGGDISLFGQRAGPGARVLARIGSFVEGSGFLPHLSGAKNLELYWRATGRPREQAYMAQALQIAGLEQAVRRKVKTYSQGMRQRLAIAQAMLGLPDLLILDEPTNGLDPPQIHAMRDVMRRYAQTGRTVLVSSHLLSEVEQTCTDVVIMARGRTITQGTVAELMAASGELLVSTPQAAAARDALETVPGIGEMETVEGGLAVDRGRSSVSAVMAALLAASVPITGVGPRNRLEEVFLNLVGAGRGPVHAGSSTDSPDTDPTDGGEQG